MLTKNKVKAPIVLFVIFLFYYILNKYLNISIPCLFHEITGFFCPGCGITRMFFSLLELNFYQAFRFNPLVFILIILGVIYWLIKLLIKKFLNISIVIPNNVYYILLIIVIIFGILRNIPGFEFLGPTKI